MPDETRTPVAAAAGPTHYSLSLGAGVNSSAMLHVILDEGLPLDEVIFADTGGEKPETYEYIEKWIRPFLTERGIPYNRVVATRGRGEAKVEDTLEARCIRGHTVPDRNYRWSTRDFKIRPIYRHLGIPGLKTRNPPTRTWVMYLGIAFDEPGRIKDAQEAWVKRCWPLWERKITRQGCKDILMSKGWPVPPKSGCYFCPFTPLSEWRWLYDTHPDLWARAGIIEQNGSKYPEFSLNRATLAGLEQRFKGEDSQSKLEAYGDEECEGFCFT